MNGNTYTGQFYKGDYHGNGKIIYSQSSSLKEFEGQFINGQRSYVILTLKSGNQYQGQFKGEKLHGRGIYTYCNG
jgi:hypothetical protein